MDEKSYIIPTLSAEQKEHDDDNCMTETAEDEYSDDEDQDENETTFQEMEADFYDDTEEIYDAQNYQTAAQTYQTEAEGATIQFCDTCDREFDSYYQYQTHMAQHRVCKLDGCTFTAHEKIVEKHIMMQHSTGLYDKIRNVNTPEDITRWIEERKKRYPSKENVEIRYKQQEEMVKRGELIGGKKNRFERNKTSYALRRKELQTKWAERRKRTQNRAAKQKPISLINDKADWNGNLFPFQGTKELYDSEDADDSSDFDDSEWTENVTSLIPPVIPAPPPVKPVLEHKIPTTNALGSLMSAYGSSEDSETESKPSQVVEGSDDEPPVEQKVIREQPLIPVQVDGQDSAKLDNAITENAGQASRKRRRKHDRRGNRGQKDDLDNKPKPSSSNRFDKPRYRKRKFTLLEKLLEPEIHHERNVILQCVRFVVRNNFFDKA